MVIHQRMGQACLQLYWCGTNEAILSLSVDAEHAEQFAADTIFMHQLCEHAVHTSWPACLGCVTGPTGLGCIAGSTGLIGIFKGLF
jgi:hypothetical protein